MTFATVISDASRDPKTGVAGWATWVACDGNRRRAAGPMQGWTRSIDDVETHALIKGITIARQEFRAGNILIQSDSLSALYRLGLPTGLKKGRFVPATALQPLRLALSGDLDFSVMCKWVKGHTRTEDARSFVNRWCDKEAGRHMRQLRDQRPEWKDPDDVPDDWDPIDREDIE